MGSTAKKVYEVAVILFEDADLLDFAGPVEMLTAFHYDNDWAKPVFKINTIGDTEYISARGLNIKVDMTVAQAKERIETFDVLEIPGGRPDMIMGMIQQDVGVVQFARQFAELKNEEGKENRIMFSVCTGALLLAATGAARDLRVSTHHWAIEMLPKVEPTATVINAFAGAGVGRYVDGGLNKNGTRILTAGGVTCGLDAALYLGELKAGLEAAKTVADMTEHDWKRVE